MQWNVTVVWKWWKVIYCEIIPLDKTVKTMDINRNLIKKWNNPISLIHTLQCRTFKPNKSNIFVIYNHAAAVKCTANGCLGWIGFEKDWTHNTERKQPPVLRNVPVFPAFGCPRLKNSKRTGTLQLIPFQQNKNNQEHFKGMHFDKTQSRWEGKQKNWLQSHCRHPTRWRFWRVSVDC